MSKDIRQIAVSTLVKRAKDLEAELVPKLDEITESILVLESRSSIVKRRLSELVEIAGELKRRHDLLDDQEQEHGS